MTLFFLAVSIISPSATATEFVSLARIFFDHDKVSLRAGAQAELTQAAALLQQNPAVTRLIVQCHTDEVGGLRYNDRLSDQRCLATLDYLRALGVRPELIHAIGYGEHRPNDENWTREGKQRNRHVEVFALVREPPPPPEVKPPG